MTESKEPTAPRHERVFAGVAAFGIMGAIQLVIGFDTLPKLFIMTSIYAAICISAFAGFFPEYRDNDITSEPTQPEGFRERFALAVILLVPVAGLFVLYDPVKSPFKTFFHVLFLFVIISCAVIGLNTDEKEKVVS